MNTDDERYEYCANNLVPKEEMNEYLLDRMMKYMGLKRTKDYDTNYDKYESAVLDNVATRSRGKGTRTSRVTIKNR